MTKLKGTDRIVDLYTALAKDQKRILSALDTAYEFGRYGEAEALLDELSVITRFINYSRNVVQ